MPPGSGGPYPVPSEDFFAPKRSNPSAPRQLRLHGPLQAILGNDVLTDSRVTIVPSSLGASDRFSLNVDASGLDGVAYTGYVDVVDAATGAAVNSVRVWVLVP